MELNERQKKAIEYIRKQGKITNTEYQKINEVTKKTATRDLQGLVKREVIFKRGRTGKGVFYVLNPVYKRTQGDMFKDNKIFYPLPDDRI